MAYFSKEKFIDMLNAKADMALGTPKQVFLSVAKILEELPETDVVEVIHAKWEINSDGYYPYCSHCKTEPKNGVMSKYCPECGAKMDSQLCIK